MDGGAHKRRRVRADEVLDLVGKERLHFSQLGRHGIRHGHGIGAIGQDNAHACTAHAVELGLNRLIFSPQLNPRHILDRDDGAVRCGLKHDVLELLDGLELGTRRDRGVELLILHRRQSTQLTGRDLGILGVQRSHQVRRHQRVFFQLGRVHPDAHGVEGTEHVDVTDAFNTADHIDQIAVDVVTNIDFSHRFIA